MHERSRSLTRSMYCETVPTEIATESVYEGLWLLNKIFCADYLPFVATE
jgi:hypothetical protein